MSLKQQGRWKGGIFILDGSVVGCIDRTASGDWCAYGCMDEWQDTPLRRCVTEAHAQKEVEYWVGEHSGDSA